MVNIVIASIAKPGLTYVYHLLIVAYGRADTCTMYRIAINKAVRQWHSFTVIC